MKKLNASEKYVMIDKGTEPPFSGEYTDHFQKGTYVCKQCGAALFYSDNKFHSGCGWPAFDDNIDKAVKRVQDPDGLRTEIICAQCGAHLGHVFTGENFTPKNTRHCVNSISLQFTSDEGSPQHAMERAVFAGGCFWGVEQIFSSLPGVVATMPGYTGGYTENPTYEEVCSGLTGHLEAVEIIYDPARIDYESLAQLFFEIHDSTQTDGQGPDKGDQYMSAVFFTNTDQKNIIEDLISRLNKKGIKPVTRIIPAATFYPAEEYHRSYYEKNGGSPYCHKRTKIW